MMKFTQAYALAISHFLGDIPFFMHYNCQHWCGFDRLFRRCSLRVRFSKPVWELRVHLVRLEG